MNWDDFFNGVASFAGVLFAVVLVARQLDIRSELSESSEENRARLWDSLSVTYELAAAALLGALYYIRGSWLGSVGALFVISVGIVLNVRALQVYLRMPKSFRSKVSDFLACLTLVPLVAFVASLASFSLWTTSDLIAVNLLAFGVGWLVFSGTTQTLYWYWRSWESRADG